MIVNFFIFKYILPYFILGSITYYANGIQIGQRSNSGQHSFHTNLDRIQLGYFANKGTKNSMASFEFYLRPLSQAEISAAMERSKTFPINPTCNAK
jgi:hypothetical protein